MEDGDPDGELIKDGDPNGMGYRVAKLPDARRGTFHKSSGIYLIGVAKRKVLVARCGAVPNLSG